VAATEAIMASPVPIALDNGAAVGAGVGASVVVVEVAVVGFGSWSLGHKSSSLRARGPVIT